MGSSLQKGRADAQPAVCIFRRDCAAHPLNQQPGDGQAEARGVPGRFEGEESVEQALGLYTRLSACARLEKAALPSGCRSTARSPSGYFTALPRMLSKIRAAPQRPAAAPPHGRASGFPRDAARGQRTAESGEALLQHVVQADGLHAQLFRRGGDDGIAEQLLRQAVHGAGALANHGEIAPRLVGEELLLQQIQLAADRRQRRAQVVGDVRHRGLQLRIAVLQLQALLSKHLKLDVDLRRESAHRPVAGGNGEERVRVRFQLFVQILRGFLQRRTQQKQMDSQRRDDGRERGENRHA